MPKSSITMKQVDATPEKTRKINRVYTPPEQPVSEEQVLTPEELISNRWLKLPSKNWVYQRIHAGTLPFPYIKIGSYLRFPVAGVRQYIESQTKPAGSAA